MCQKWLFPQLFSPLGTDWNCYLYRFAKTFITHFKRQSLLLISFHSFFHFQLLFGLARFITEKFFNFKTQLSQNKHFHKWPMGLFSLGRRHCQNTLSKTILIHLHALQTFAVCGSWIFRPWLFLQIYSVKSRLDMFSLMAFSRAVTSSKLYQSKLS